MDPEKNQMPEAPDPVSHSRFFRWFDNIWYHYKWHIIIGAFAVFALVVCLVQCSSRQTYDLSITYAGNRSLNQTEQDGLNAALDAILPEDFDGNGTKSVQLISYAIYTDEEILKMYSAENSEGIRIVDQMAYGNAMNQNGDERTAFSTHILTGESAVWFVSPNVFDTHALASRVVPLAEIFGDNLPQGATGEYAVRLGDTAFYKTYQVVSDVLPEDTLILLARQTITGRVSKSTNYENCKSTYLAIVNFHGTN